MSTPDGPDSPEMHVDEDDEHIDQQSRPNFGDTAPSCTGGGSAAHNTANTPSSTPLNPTLLDTTCPNNSVNTMPTPPNPHTSNSEREPSPLSNSFDEEEEVGEEQHRGGEGEGAAETKEEDSSGLPQRSRLTVPW
jgi:hypothetical protein